MVKTLDLPAKIPYYSQVHPGPMNDPMNEKNCNHVTPPVNVAMIRNVCFVTTDHFVFHHRIIPTSLIRIETNFFPSNAFLRRRRKKALLRVNDRGGVWRMCILGLCRVYVRTCARTSAVNLRRYGDTPQTITIYDLIEISLLCAAHATVKFSGVKLCLP